VEVSGELHAAAALHTRNIPGAHWVESCVGFRDGLDAMGNINPAPAGNRILVPQPEVRRYTDWAEEQQK
jgi:hypothetical protein